MKCIREDNKEMRPFNPKQYLFTVKMQSLDLRQDSVRERKGKAKKNVALPMMTNEPC